MNTLPTNEPAGVLIKTTGVDFPGRIAGSFFLRGCNLRCPYCYNTELVTGNKNAQQNQNNENSQNQINTQLNTLNTIDELFSHLEKRQGILSGLVISGGEPLLNPYTPLIIKKAKELNYKVKLDTNGTLPQELSFFVENENLKPDFIAMDLKTTPEKYASVLCNKVSKFYNNTEYFFKNLQESIKIISSYPQDCREWRTVLVPPLVSKDEIKIMAQMLPTDATWQFAQFQPGNCICPEYNNITPYTDSEIQDLVDFARTFIPNANLR